MSLLYSTSIILRFFCFMVYYCDLKVIKPLMVILQIMFVKEFLVMRLVWQFLFFPNITMCAFIVIAILSRYNQCIIDKEVFFTEWFESVYLINIGRAALTKCYFIFLLFLKPIIDTSENTLLWPATSKDCI